MNCHVCGETLSSMGQVITKEGLCVTCEFKRNHPEADNEGRNYLARWTRIRHQAEEVRRSIPWLTI